MQAAERSSWLLGGGHQAACLLTHPQNGRKDRAAAYCDGNPGKSLTPPSPAMVQSRPGHLAVLKRFGLLAYNHRLPWWPPKHVLSGRTLLSF